MNILTIYDAYPRKVGKPVALRAIQKAVKEFGLEHVLERTKAYELAREGQDAQFTPHPATWFNQQRFNDDPATWGRKLEITQEIYAYHVRYETLAGIKLTLGAQEAVTWERFLKRRTPQFTHGDLVSVVNYIRKTVDRKFQDGALRFSNLIGNPLRFEEWLGPALQALRPRQPATKTIREGGFNKIVDNPGTEDAAKSAGSIVSNLELGPEYGSPEYDSWKEKFFSGKAEQ